MTISLKTFFRGVYTANACAYQRGSGLQSIEMSTASKNYFSTHTKTERPPLCIEEDSGIDIIAEYRKVPPGNNARIEH